MKKKEKDKKEKLPSYGGQALLEGVMMRGVSTVAMAVRTSDGDILVDAKRLKSGKKWYRKIPVVRGVFAFGESLFTGVKSLTKSAEVSAPEGEKIGKGWMGFAVFLGLALGVGLFILLPMLLNSLVIDNFIPGNILLSSLVEGLLRIVIFVLYLVVVSLMKDIRRTFQYHGAEHRTINCFEQGLDLTVENVQKCSTRHNRCGTTFLFFVMLVSILVFSLANWFIAEMGITADAVGKIPLALIKLAIRLGFLPLVAGLSYELLRGLAALPNNWFTNIFRMPGLALQRLTTYPPENGMAEVALTSFLEAYSMDSDPLLPELEFGQFRYVPYRERVEKKLAGINADTAETDWIFCDVTGYRRAELREIKILTFEQHKKIKRILERRLAGEPLWYILGYCEFYGNRLIINHNALIPRFETELLCEEAIKEIKARKETPPHVLDLCTGSGCIALTLAQNTDAALIASDFSEPALSVAINNLEGTEVGIVFSDLFDNLKGRTFDVIVSNPPYIKTDELDSLEIEVKHYEPIAALDGGKDGLDFYRRIIAAAPMYLNPNGCILFEVGYDQAADVAKLLEKNFKGIEVKKDLALVDRIIKGYLK